MIRSTNMDRSTPGASIYLGIEKHFLIGKPDANHPSWFMQAVFWLGLGCFIAGVAWLVFLVYVFRVVVTFDPKAVADWSNAGQAFGAPIGLANLGAIILSVKYLVRQLQNQQHADRTRYQPVVACGALLAYVVEGIEGKGKMRIVSPHVRILLRNLGDSPATFVDVIVHGLRYAAGAAESQTWLNMLRHNVLHIDHLAQDSNGSPSDVVLPLVGLPDPIAELIDAMFWKAPAGADGRLELDVELRHENVMGVQYQHRGTFVWSRKLCGEGDCDPEQKDYIESVRLAREHPSKGSVTIGHFIRHNRPLLGVVKRSTINSWKNRQGR